MSIFSFLSSKTAQKPDENEQSLPQKTHLEAIELAERHARETEEKTALFSKEKAESLSDEDLIACLDAIEEEQQWELDAAQVGMSVEESLMFQEAYSERTMRLLEVQEKKVEEAFRSKNPEMYAAKQAAKELFNEFEAGNDVADWVRKAANRGIVHGRETGGELVADEVYEKQDAMTKKWLESLPPDIRDRSECVYSLGRNKGVRDALSKDAADGPTLGESSTWDTQEATIRFLAGDFGSGKGYLLASGKVRIPNGVMDFPMSAVSTVEVANEESVKRIGGAVGWGVAGAALFGPAGLIAGSVLGGKGTDVTFVGMLTDGKRFLVTARSEVYQQFLAATFS